MPSGVNVGKIVNLKSLPICLTKVQIIRVVHTSLFHNLEVQSLIRYNVHIVYQHIFSFS